MRLGLTALVALLASYSIYLSLLFVRSLECIGPGCGFELAIAALPFEYISMVLRWGSFPVVQLSNEASRYITGMFLCGSFSAVALKALMRTAPAS